jgi:hypothetical protein
LCWTAPAVVLSSTLRRNVQVSAWLGHASLDATQINTLPTDDDLDAAIARLTVDR